MTLFEQDGRLGGHTHTVVLDQGPDRGLGVDTGFIVLNDRNYPLLHRFLDELGVSTRDTDMSFGYLDEASGFCWAGTGLNGLFAQRKNLLSPGFWNLLGRARRFHKAGNEALDSGTARGLSLGAWLKREGLEGPVAEHYIVPMGAAIWSAPHAGILDFPAESYLGFFRNHGLLGVTDRPQWQTVVGGSHSYLKAFAARFPGTLRLDSPVTSVRRTAKGVDLEGPGWAGSFDAVVLAAHADESLAMLKDADSEERRLLGAWRTQANETVLHTDAGVLPPLRRAWASWNYLRPSQGPSDAVGVTYHMNRLQGLPEGRPYFVSLNLTARIAPEKILRRMVYRHPIYDAGAVATQTELPGLNGRRNTWFAGSYFGHGFHEDAVRSANEVGRAFGEVL